MGIPNKTKLIIGLVFMVISFGFIIAIFYYLDHFNLANQEKISSLENQIATLIQENKKDKTAQKKISSGNSGEQISLESLMQKAGGVYDPGEKNRNQGILWIDRQSKSFIVTLGALNGIHLGSKLTVYDGEKKIDTLSVDLPFTIVSFVKPTNKPLDFFSSNYYRVVAEN